MRRTRVVLLIVMTAVSGWNVLKQTPAAGPEEIPASCGASTADPITCVDGNLQVPSDWLVKNSQGVPVTPPVSFSGKFDTNCEFYYWSWQEFLNLTQPSDPTKPSSNPVFINLAPALTLFPQTPGTVPPTWEDASGASANGVDGNPRKSKNDPDAAEDAQAGSAELLVTSTGTGANAVYYSMHVNKCYYEFIRSNSLYLKSLQAKLTPASPIATFPVGAVETKSSWIITGTYANDTDTTPTYFVPDPDRFFMTDGYVGDPVVESGAWSESTTQKKVRLGLVGMHIVGRVENHPEMIWATFEHRDNAPTVGTNGDITDKVNPRTYNNAGTTTHLPWSLYNGTTSATNCNAGLEPTAGVKIAPTNVCQLNPYGMKPGDNSTNTQNITSLNSNVLAKQGGSVWSNYFLSGATWTSDGKTGVLPAVNNPTDPGKGNVKGSLFLANTTMESFTQYGDSKAKFKVQNCMVCHNISSSELPITISHLVKFNSQAPVTPKSLVKLYDTLDLKNVCFTPPASVQKADGIAANDWQACMLKYGNFDLWKASDVIANAPNINGMLTSKQMPPKEAGGPMSPSALKVWAQFYKAYQDANAAQ